MSLVEPTWTPFRNTLPLSRPSPDEDVSAVTFRLSIFTSSPLAMILKVAHFTLLDPFATAAVGESEERVIEGADVETELMVADVAECAANVAVELVLLPVIKTG